MYKRQLLLLSGGDKCSHALAQAMVSLLQLCKQLKVILVRQWLSSRHDVVLFQNLASIGATERLGKVMCSIHTDHEEDQRSMNLGLS